MKNQELQTKATVVENFSINLDWINNFEIFILKTPLQLSKEAGKLTQGPADALRCLGEMAYAQILK